MNASELPKIPRRGTRRDRGLPLRAIACLVFLGPLGAVAAESTVASPPNVAPDDDAAGDDDVISLGSYNVKADRIEDFGFRVRPSFISKYPKTVPGFFLGRCAPIITAVVPNTAAAKAGLQPGEYVLKSEGQSVVGGVLSSVQLRKWFKIQKKKWTEVAAGKKDVTWTLEVQTPTKAIRTVKLVVPTPSPRWGSAIWQKSEGRRPGTVAEPGPLAERSRGVLENGIWASLNERHGQLLGLDFRGGPPSDFASGREPAGYEWHIGQEREAWHRIFVTQFRGRTDVFLETRSPRTGIRIYLTSPSGTLEKAWQWPPKGKQGAVSLADAQAGFTHELDLWTTKIEKVSARWPLEVKPGYDPNAIFAALAAKDGPVAVETARPFAAEFLKLPSATEAERTLFTEAYGKLGVETDRWAYTETSHGMEDKKLRVMRVDPSKPEAERCLLLSVDGKAPTADEVQEWRDDGGDVPKPLGDIPPLTNLVDLKDLRVAKNEDTVVVFELPIRSDSADFPAEKFQALFRVNKTQRAFEAITVKLRESFRVAGAVKVTEAGFEARFQTFDPALAPQPVFLKAGGGARVLLVKISRSFEATRRDFKRVAP